MFPKSIAKKIMFFYIAGILVTIIISGVFLSEIRLIAQKIELQESISNLYEAVLEIRRTEKKLLSVSQ